MSRILVTGASGVVGGYVTQVFSEHELVLTDLASDLERMDVADPGAVRDVVGSVSPDVVIHLAAATDVDLCEKDPDLAFRTNALGTQNVALACRNASAVLVYTSTAGVFGGDKHSRTQSSTIPALRTSTATRSSQANGSSRRCSTATTSFARTG